MKIRTKKQDYLKKVDTGYIRMKDYRVAICAIVRDCEKSLKKNIPVINKLKSCFRESHIVVVENDSNDGTKDLLLKWSQSVENVHVISEDIGSQNMPEVEGNVPPWFACHRIKLMASYRNKYMEFIDKSNWELDYVIVVDLDFRHLSIDGISNSFGQDINWDAITSNGKIKDKYGYKYYDTYAFREIGDTSVQTEESIYTYQNLLSDLDIGMIMFRVSSAFNGLAIYKAEAIKGLKYRCELNDDLKVESVCEHVTLHQDMASRGNDLIYVNPSQLVYYKSLESGLNRLIKKIKRKLAGITKYKRQYAKS
ncbi:MAG: glycosyltransferase family 69 protein [Candidatus Omnitrophica bacterium]|nr:glycosyltransferase family 69 protein [Candidatus Omnitrophota bacterium]